jgi:hypothetical protein
MTATQLTKNWTISPNIRQAFVSLADLSGWWIYQNHAALLAVGWTVKLTSDGTTGPANNADTTNRILSKTDADTRGASAVAIQSYTVLQNADGVQLLLAFQGATDDIIRVSWSPGGLYLINITDSRFQPTATDEVVITSAFSIVNSALTLDRVMTIWCSADTKHWSNAAFRNNAYAGAFIGLERVNSLCGPGILAVPYVGYKYNNPARSVAPGGNGPTHDPANAIAVGGTGWFGTGSRVFTNTASRLIRLGAGTITLPGAAASTKVVEDVMFSLLPAAQGAAAIPLVPCFWTGENSANLDGVFGYPIDFWLAYSNSLTINPAFGDFFPGFEPGDVPGVSGGQTGVGDQRTNWIIAFGPAYVRPWKNAAASIQII